MPQDFVLSDKINYTNISSTPIHIHIHHSLQYLSSLHHFLVFFILFFGSIFAVCMLTYSPLHMVISPSLLPYTGRFHPHVLQLVTMACVSLPLVLYYGSPGTVYTHQWYMNMYPTLTVFYIWLVLACCITRMTYRGGLSPDADVSG